MIDFLNAKSIVTPKGEIAKIARGAEILWQKSRLPLEYQEVEYLESSGTQYINTGIFGSTKYSGVEVVWQFSNSDGNMCIFSTRSAQTTNTVTLFWLKTVGNRARFDGVGQKYFTDAINTEEDQVYRFAYQSAAGAVAQLENLVDGKVQEIVVDELTTFSNNPLYLFATRDKGAVASSIKVKSFKWYEGEDLVRDFVPCCRKSDSKPGMYDLVTDTFFTNAGTGEFLIGGAV